MTNYHPSLADLANTIVTAVRKLNDYYDVGSGLSYAFLTGSPLRNKVKR